MLARLGEAYQVLSSAPHYSLEAARQEMGWMQALLPAVCELEEKGLRHMWEAEYGGSSSMAARSFPPAASDPGYPVIGAVQSLSRSHSHH
ncbi:MAG: hypothetical protein VB144_14670 [Clostridia bacterium]|nr:hypothetical protein [Clostridia bacterium]